MLKMALYMHTAGIISLGLALLFHALTVMATARRRPALVVAGAQETAGPGALAIAQASSGTRVWDSAKFATMMVWNGLVFLTLSMTFRWVATGHGPFSDMYEFSLSFAWGVTAAWVYFERKYRVQPLSVLVLPVALGFLLYAMLLTRVQPNPLVPALQNSLLLTLHVAVAIVAYGTFAVSFGAAILYLVQRSRRLAWLPALTTLDEMGYRGVMLGFPFMALVLLLGALWADVAWGRYWSWDPKETATLITWLIYGGYLHARTLRGWKGTRSAVLLIIGFLAVLFTYFGNYFFSGLHSYGGLK